MSLKGYHRSSFQKSSLFLEAEDGIGNTGGRPGVREGELRKRGGGGAGGKARGEND